MKYIVFVCLLLFVVASCRSSQPPLKTVEVREVVTTILRDTIIKQTADSSLLTALLACDSTGNVLLKQLSKVKAGKQIKPPEIIIRNNILYAECVVDSALIYFTWVEKHIKTDSITTEHPPPIYRNKLSAWQNMQLQAGRIALLVIALYFILKRL